MKRVNSSSKDNKWKYMTNPQNENKSSSKKIMNKSNSKLVLKEKNSSPLNIKIDLSSSLNNDDCKPTKNSSTMKKGKSLNKEENIRVFIRLKPKTAK